MLKALGEGHKVDLDGVLYVRKTYGGMQKANVRLPIQAAKKLPEKPTIRVNWSSCEIRGVIKPTKCLKYWQYGHITKNCTSEVNRSNCRIKCSAEGQKAWRTWEQRMLIVQESVPSPSLKIVLKVLQINLNHCEAAQDLLT